MNELQEQFFETDRVRWLRWIPALHLLRAAQLAACPANWLMGLIISLSVVSLASVDAVEVPSPVLSFKPIGIQTYLLYSFWYSLSILVQTPVVIPRIVLETPLTGLLLALVSLLGGYWISRQTVSLFLIDRSQSPVTVIKSLLRNASAWGTAAALSLATLTAVLLPCLFIIWLMSDFAESSFSWNESAKNVWAMIPQLIRAAFGLIAAVATLVIMLALSFQVVFLAAEECDGFEAFSRSIQMILARWRALLLLLIFSLLSGAFTLTVLNVLINVLLEVAETGETNAISLPHELKLIDETDLWLMIKIAYAYSFWWVTLTLSFFVVRQSIESTPIRESALTKS